MPNRLADSTSPYLLRCADDPVDWWPWGADAFAEAARRGVPVLLSIGSATSHWCRVMDEESYRDEQTAAFVDEHFVAVKVDRQEGPDVDAVHQRALQLMTGHAGWPTTCWLTPVGEPFSCGTYWPPVARQGTPGFREVLEQVAHTWQARRGEVEAAAADVVQRLGRPVGPAATPVTPALLDAAVASLRTAYDGVHGGFGAAPKSPPATVLLFLLRHATRTGQGLELVEHTCRSMAAGGLVDQLGGGFARACADAQWAVPRPERTLTDNALLLRVYAQLWRVTGAADARRVALQTAGFLLRGLRTEQGGFAASLVAGGEQGRAELWTPGELRDALGEQDGAWAVEQFDVTATGTAARGASALQRLGEPDDPERFAGVCARLLEVRAARPRAERDDTVVAAGNGLAVTALTEAGVLLGQPDLVTAAGACADLLGRVHWDGRRLRRTSLDGVAGRHPGVLEDYACVAEGLLTLSAATGDLRRQRAALALLDVVLEQFTDGRGALFDTAADAEALVLRPREPAETAGPSGVAAAAGALLTAAAVSGRADLRQTAESALATTGPLRARRPRSAGWAGAVGEALAAGMV